MKKEIPKRVFEFKGKNLTDPNPSFSSEEVVKHYSAIYPEMLNSKVESQELSEDPKDKERKILLIKIGNRPGTLG